MATKKYHRISVNGNTRLISLDTLQNMIHQAITSNDAVLTDYLISLKFELWNKGE